MKTSKELEKHIKECIENPLYDEMNEIYFEFTPNELDKIIKEEIRDYKENKELNLDELIK